MIPRHLRSTICASFHTNAQFAHSGAFKTYQLLRLRYVWRGMYSFVSTFIMSCREFQRRQSPPQSQTAPLQPLPCPARPFDRVEIDLYGGPLPLNTAGNRWVIVAVDYLTRYAETGALPAATAREVVTFILHHFILRHGSPRELLRDRGRVFLSEVSRLFSKNVTYPPQHHNLPSPD